MTQGDPLERDPLASVMVTAPIIKLALAMGVTVFAGVAFYLGRVPQGGPNMTVVWSLAAMGIATALMRLIVPRMIVAKGRTAIAAGTWMKSPTGYPAPPATDEGKLAMLYQTQMIVGSAMLEGGIFANVFAYMSEMHIISILVAGLLWAGLLIDFPTRFAISSWIDNQLRLVRDDRPLIQRES